MQNINESIEKYKNERNQSPVSSQDYDKTKNDWTSLIGYHLFECASKEDRKITFEEFRNSMSVVAALAIRAIEISYEHENQPNNTNSIIKKINDKDTNETIS